jgi:Ca-activated chloride channel family protein
MFHFIWPDLLWGLTVIPLLIALYLWILNRRRRVAVVYPSLSIIRPALVRSRKWRRHIPPFLLMCAIASALIGGARPSAQIVLPADYLTLVMAMDVSRSMLAQDVPPSRIEAAQAAAKEFLKDLPANVRVGIVSFAGAAQLVQNVTDQREDLISAIDRFQLQRGTATGSGLLVALATLLPDAGIDVEAAIYGSDFVGGGNGARPLERRPNAKVEKKPPPPVPVGSYSAGAILLLSDGRRTTGIDPMIAAKIAADRGVRVYTVAFGTPDGFIPGMEGGGSYYTKVDEETLQAISKITEGEFFKASNANDLKVIYQHLSSRFALEKRDTEISALFAMASIVLVLLAGFLSMLWFRRPVSNIILDQT